MALFTSKKNTSAVAPEKNEAGGSGVARDLSHVLSHARITEKATTNQGAKVYTFTIAQSATKRDIIRAIHQIYQVTPQKVHVLSIPAKPIRHAKTGKTGVKGGGRKAYVYLKSGDTIIVS